MLSAFDCIGAAHLVVDRDFGRPLWEVNRACDQVVQTQLPRVQHQGDITKENADDVLALIQEADPGGSAIVIWRPRPRVRISPSFRHVKDMTENGDDSSLPPSTYGEASSWSLRTPTRSHDASAVHPSSSLRRTSAVVAVHTVGDLHHGPGRHAKWDRLRLDLRAP